MDNYFKNCPAVMSDGRVFTDYKTATRTNEYIKYINGIIRDDDYRMLLQQNGEKFLDADWKFQKQKMYCREVACVHKYPTRTLPQYFPLERRDYDALSNPKIQHVNTCPKYSDYRLTTSYNNGVSDFQPHTEANFINSQRK